MVCALILSRMFFGNFANAAFAVIVGLLVGVLIGFITEVYTSGTTVSLNGWLNSPRPAC